jgi:hypothetical protein
MTVVGYGRPSRLGVHGKGLVATRHLIFAEFDARDEPARTE